MNENDVPSSQAFVRGLGPVQLALRVVRRHEVSRRRRHVSHCAAQQTWVTVPLYMGLERCIVDVIEVR